ncbi:MAG: hypothetical protein HY913_17030 [Desulfomonile tiedjei]|nr:hypothetical protein [Desulfomonile tiedjei]
MKILVPVMLAFLNLAFAAEAQETFTAYGSTVMYTRPDPSQWNLVHDGIDAKSNAFLLMFEHNPIEDAEGRKIRPVMALICETVPEAIDVIKYSIGKRVQVPFDVKEMLTPQRGNFTHSNSVGYEGEYKRGAVVHKVLVGHLRHKVAGVQVICDSTDGVYDKVEADMRAFLFSITFKE